MPRLKLAIEQITLARNYTVRLLDHIRPEDWFRQPSEGVTHLAWQVGHLAVAEYRLALARVRGQLASDANLLPEAFLPLFGRQSVPDPDPGRYPSPAGIRAVLDRVHQQVLHELPLLDASGLDSPANGPPHPVATTRLWSLLWCAQHEMVHAGQIGLLRRFLGFPPIW